MKRNGELGASAHVISEDSKIRFTRLLLSLREDSSLPSIEMPADLTNTERKFIHELAKNMGLSSKSHGKGEERRIKVAKVNEKKVTAGVAAGQGDGEEATDGDLPKLDVGPKAASLLAGYLSSHPAAAPLLAESKKTGSSITASSSTSDAALSNLLSRLLPKAVDPHPPPPPPRFDVEERRRSWGRHQQAKERWAQ
ncbi:hypothetical protein TeGR_g627 [Tetraparma gracilis]|uniref:R3H domain-containing protein n=1 Tax=Tetraparma gracilis TaxID=2962635 RepID=A0ABQ6MX29_9STRA|nr:hypothetical protein TeGR_g627 [Tetraparma gracilis]